jgi:hypothetical protein
MLVIGNHIIISIFLIQLFAIFIQLLALEQIRRALHNILLGVVHLDDTGHLVADAGSDRPFRDVLVGAQAEKREAFILELSVIG